LSTFFIGDKDWQSVASGLEKAVKDFNDALSHFGFGAVFKTLEEVRGILTEVPFSHGN
jgi:hypothetical protein